MMAVVPFPARHLISDNERHFDTWNRPEIAVEIKKRAELAVDDQFSRGVKQLLNDREYFDRKTIDICFREECVGNLHLTYERVTQLLELEEKRRATGHWTYRVSTELALRQFRTAVCLRLADEAKARGAH
jgi:hypothetical protein